MPDPSREQVDKLFSAAYEELRRLASKVRRSDDPQTLNPTALRSSIRTLERQRPAKR